MAEEQAPELQAAGEDITGLNEQLLDRLRLLNYEKEYLQKGGKALNNASFSFPGNPTEQFNNFKNLVKWLFTINDIPASDFSKYDDPMTVSTNILNECKKVGIPCDFPPLKLKGGCGEQALMILNQLAAKAMKKKNFSYKKPRYEDVKGAYTYDGPDEQTKPEDNEDMIDEAEIPDEDDLDDKEHIGVAAIDQDKQIIHSAVNQNDWKLECQRVANKLKVATKADTKEWRAHIDSTKNCGELIKKNFPQARTILQKLNDDLSRTLDKISKSQRIINSNMSDIGDQYKNQSQELKKLSTHYNNLSASLKEMNENSRLVSQKLEQIQTKIDEHSGNMTDSSPVVKIKESLKNILVEIKTMDVRMGVLSHTILGYKTKEKNSGGKAGKNIEVEELYDFE